jgi:SWI/SNF-related matrix-associated actin-dependent regulator of chromatin subfamily A3
MSLGNAIQVKNVQGDQIGHIPRGPASKLAKYMDQGQLLVEGVTTGSMGHFDCPIALMLYGTEEPGERDRLINQMKADNLPINTATNRWRQAEREERERQKAAAKAAKEAARLAKTKKNAGAIIGSGQGIDYGNTISEFAAGAAGGLTQSDMTMEDILSSSERFNPRNVEQVRIQCPSLWINRLGIASRQQPNTAYPMLPKLLVPKMYLGIH